MKKIISLVLLLSLCLGLFAGCQLPGTQPEVPAASNLENAKTLVFNTYKPANKDEIPFKSTDFEVMTSVLVDGETFPVAWTVEVTEGPAEAVKIVDGSSEAFKKVDLTEKPEVDVKFTLTATISDAEGNTATVSFKYQTPKFEAPTADKVVIKFPKDNKYATGTEYKYTSSSSGSVKMELVLSDAKADAIAFTMIEDAATGYVTFKTDDGYYLSADGTNVQFDAEENDNTKFVLEVADGGYYIKCAIANYNGKAQYLEVYSGYLTCYGMGSDPSIYVFALEAADGATGKVVKEGSGDTTEPTDPTDPTDPPVAQLPEISAPAADTAYKFGVIQVTNGHTVYITGEVSGRYLATTTDKAAAADVYVEAVDGGYKFYILVDGAKNYIYIYNNAESKRSVGFSTTEANVFTYKADIATWATTFSDKDCYVGSYNNFDTLSVSDLTYINAENAGITQFPAGFFPVEDTTEPSEPTDPTEPEATEPDDDGIMSIPEVLASAEGTAVVVKGTVSEIYQAWSDQYSNISFYISDEAGNKLLVFRTGTNAKVGDKVTVTGTATLYNNVVQIAQGGVTVIDEVHVCSEYTEATCANLAACVVCGTTTGELAGHNFVDGTCDVCGAVEGVSYSTESMSIVANAGTLSSDSLSISWTGTAFTFTAQKGTNNNAIRTSDSDHFRVYQGNNVIISGNNGAKLAKVVFTCTSSSYAEVMVKSANTAEGVTATASGSVVTLVLAENVESITYSTTAQTRINNIEVTYVAA